MPQLKMTWFLFYFILAWTLILMLWPIMTKTTKKNSKEMKSKSKNKMEKKWKW